LVKTDVQAGNAGSYSVVVSNIYGSVTSAVVSLTLPVLPSISSQPQSQTNLAGSTATFSVTASGTPPLTYQWFKNGVILADGDNVSGAGTSTLTLTNVQFSDATNYGWWWPTLTAAPQAWWQG